MEISKICARIADYQIMRPEQRGYSPSNAPIIEKQPVHGVKANLREKAGQLIVWYTENIAASINPHYHKDYVQRYIEAIKAGYLPVYIGSHTAQIDIFFLSHISSEGVGMANDFLPEDQQIKGAITPFAKSMQTGAQGSTAAFMFDSMKQSLWQNGIKDVYTTTDHDREERGLADNPEEFMTEMLKAMREGYLAVAALPEGSVDGGRKGTDGKCKGLQSFREGFSAAMLILAKRMRKKGVVFIPVGIEGSEKINDPNRRWPTFKGLVAGFWPNPNIVKINVGLPVLMSYDDPETKNLIRTNPRALDDRNACAIAELLSPERRGKYK